MKARSYDVKRVTLQTKTTQPTSSSCDPSSVEGTQHNRSCSGELVGVTLQAEGCNEEGTGTINKKMVSKNTPLRTDWTPS